ncbi:MAG: hypothetical protein ACKO4A_03125, partial [Gammaproteobacteria bacterium]
AGSGRSVCLVDGLLAPARLRLKLEEVRARLAALDADSEPPVSSHRELRKLLDGIPVQARGPAWHEVSVVLDARFRMNPAEAFRSFEHLREHYTLQGKAGQFERFWVELRESIAPWTLTQHGYTRALAGRDHAEVWRGVERIVSELASLGHRAFINSGTLLGAVREGRLIGHDDDVDLAVVLQGSDPQAIAIEWCALRRALAARGLLDEAFEREREMHCKLRCVGGVSVDLFPAWLAGGQAYVFPHTFGEVAESDLLPLAAMDIAGVSVPVPQHPQALLAINYGPGWRTPDPTFRFAWGRAAKRFRPFIDACKAERGKA